MRATFDEGLSTPLAVKIFKKLPVHIFYDIKKPQAQEQSEHYMNPYNPARKYPYQSFFDMRNHEEWLKTKEENRNINNNVSRYTRI